MSWKFGLVTLAGVVLLGVVSTTATGQDTSACTGDCTEVTVEYYCKDKEAWFYDMPTCFPCDSGAAVCKKNSSTDGTKTCKVSAGPKVTALIYKGDPACDKACDQQDPLLKTPVVIVEGVKSGENIKKMAGITPMVCLKNY